MRRLIDTFLGGYIRWWNIENPAGKKRCRKLPKSRMCYGPRHAARPRYNAASIILTYGYVAEARTRVAPCTHFTGSGDTATTRWNWIASRHELLTPNDIRTSWAFRRRTASDPYTRYWGRVHAVLRSDTVTVGHIVFVTYLLLLQNQAIIGNISVNEHI